MWHYDIERDGSRSEDFQPTIIKSEWYKTNAFIFLGEKNREAIDFKRVCEVLDRLPPLYLHIEIASKNGNTSLPLLFSNQVAEQNCHLPKPPIRKISK